MSNVLRASMVLPFQTFRSKRHGASPPSGIRQVVFGESVGASRLQDSATAEQLVAPSVEAVGHEDDSRLQS